jgi:hypothetical protein
VLTNCAFSSQSEGESLVIVSDTHIDAALRAQGWTGTTGLEYKKGDWEVVFDTSSWMVTFSAGKRLFDVHVPGEYAAGWTANLIENLCTTADENVRLRAALENVQRAQSLDEAIQHARIATGV